MKELITHLKQHEGYRGEIYKDSTGNLTCGWGHKIAEGSPVSEEINDLFFKKDVTDAVAKYWQIPKEYRSKLNHARRRVIVCMVFQLGYAGTWAFRKMWAAIYLEDWTLAAAEMLKSKWHEQTPKRCEELAEIMRTGEWG